MSTTEPTRRIGRRGRRSVLAAFALPLVAALSLISGASAASAAEPPSPPPEPDASEDASCATRPTSYPADGDPVPAEAGCALISGVDGSAIGEAWFWRDVEGARWYNYAAADLTDAEDGRVMMCGSTNSTVDNLPFSCTPDSTYLLFTVEGVFVDWPAAPSADLYFCQRIAFGSGDAAVQGTACATVLSASSEESGEPVEPDGEPTSAAPEESAAPTSDPLSPAPADPTGTGDGPADEGDTDTSQPTADDPTASGTDAEPGTDAGADQATSGTSGTGTTPGRPTLSSADVGIDTYGATPIASETIARVGGSGFPVGFVLALALALALAGYVVLAGPGFVAARRTRR